MKYFCIKIIAFLLPLLFLLFLCTYAIPKDTNSYLCEYKHKIELLKTTQQPRIIFIGGSNIAFGLDTKQVQDSLHCKVVNLGLHAGIGLRFPCNDYIKYIKRGDIVIFQFEYSNFLNYSNNSGYYNGESQNLADLMIATKWERRKSLDLRSWLTVLEGLPSIVKRDFCLISQYGINGKYKSPDTNYYAMSGFNDLGDEINHYYYQSNVVELPSNTLKLNNVLKSFINWLEKTLKRYEEKGAIVYMLPPVIVKSYLPFRYSNEIEVLLEQIGYPYIADPEYMTVDDSCYFNTEYHMNKAGRALNTEHIINILNNLIYKDKL